MRKFFFFALLKPKEKKKIKRMRIDHKVLPPGILKEKKVYSFILYRKNHNKLRNE